MNEPDSRAAIRPWSSLIAHRRWRITSKVIGSSPARLACAGRRHPRARHHAPGAAGESRAVGSGADAAAEADGEQAVDLRRGSQAGTTTLSPIRSMIAGPVDLVPGAQRVAVVDPRRREAGRLEVRVALALAARPTASGPALSCSGKATGSIVRVPDDAVELDLVAAAQQQRALAVDLPVALDEAREHPLAGRRVERPRVDRRPRPCGPAGGSARRACARARSPRAGAPSRANWSITRCSSVGEARRSARQGSRR